MVEVKEKNMSSKSNLIPKKNQTTPIFINKHNLESLSNEEIKGTIYTSTENFSTNAKEDKDAFYTHDFLEKLIIPTAFNSFILNLKAMAYEKFKENPGLSSQAIYITPKNNNKFNVLEFFTELQTALNKNQSIFDLPNYSISTAFSNNSIVLCKLNKSQSLNTTDVKHISDQALRHVLEDFENNWHEEKQSDNSNQVKNNELIKYQTTIVDGTHVPNFKLYNLIWNTEKKAYFIRKFGSHLKNELIIGNVFFDEQKKKIVSFHSFFDFKINKANKFNSILLNNGFFNHVLNEIAFSIINKAKAFNSKVNDPDTFKKLISDYDKETRKKTKEFQNYILNYYIGSLSKNKDLTEQDIVNKLNSLYSNSTVDFNKVYKQVFSEIVKDTTYKNYQFERSFNILFFNKISSSKEYHHIIVGEFGSKKIVYDVNLNKFGKGNSIYDALKDLFEENKHGIYGKVYAKLENKELIIDSKTNKEYTRDIFNQKLRTATTIATTFVITTGILATGPIGLTATGATLASLSSSVGLLLSANMAKSAIEMGKQVYESKQMEGKRFFNKPFDREHLQFYFMVAMSISVFTRSISAQVAARTGSQTAKNILDAATKALYALDVYDISTSSIWFSQNPTFDTFENLALAIYFSFVGDHVKETLARGTIKHALKGGDLLAFDESGKQIKFSQDIEIKLIEPKGDSYQARLLNIKKHGIQLFVNGKRANLILKSFSDRFDTVVSKSYSRDGKIKDYLIRNRSKILKNLQDVSLALNLKLDKIDIKTFIKIIKKNGLFDMEKITKAENKDKIKLRKSLMLNNKEKPGKKFYLRFLKLTNNERGSLNFSSEPKFRLEDIKNFYKYGEEINKQKVKEIIKSLKNAKSNLTSEENADRLFYLNFFQRLNAYLGKNDSFKLNQAVLNDFKSAKDEINNRTFKLLIEFSERYEEIKKQSPHIPRNLLLNTYLRKANESFWSRLFKRKSFWSILSGLFKKSKKSKASDQQVIKTSDEIKDQTKPSPDQDIKENKSEDQTKPSPDQDQEPTKTPDEIKEETEEESAIKEEIENKKIFEETEKEIEAFYDEFLKLKEKYSDERIDELKAKKAELENIEDPNTKEKIQFFKEIFEQVEQKKSELETTDQTIENYKQSIKQLEENKTKLQDKIKELNDQKSELEGKSEKIKEYNKIVEQLEQQKAELDAKDKEIKEYSKSIEKLEQQKSKLEKTIMDLQSKIKEIEVSKEEVEKVENLSTKEEIKKYKETIEQIKQKKSELGGLNQKFEHSNKAPIELQKEKLNLENTIKELTAQKEQLENENENVQEYKKLIEFIKNINQYKQTVEPIKEYQIKSEILEALDKKLNGEMGPDLLYRMSDNIEDDVNKLYESYLNLTPESKSFNPDLIDKHFDLTPPESTLLISRIKDLPFKDDYKKALQKFVSARFIHFFSSRKRRQVLDTILETYSIIKNNKETKQQILEKLKESDDNSSIIDPELAMFLYATYLTAKNEFNSKQIIKEFFSDLRYVSEGVSKIYEQTPNAKKSSTDVENIIRQVATIIENPKGKAVSGFTKKLRIGMLITWLALSAFSYNTFIPLAKGVINTASEKRKISKTLNSLSEDSKTKAVSIIFNQTKSLIPSLKNKTFDNVTPENIQFKKRSISFDLKSKDNSKYHFIVRVVPDKQLTFPISVYEEQTQENQQTKEQTQENQQTKPVINIYVKHSSFNNIVKEVSEPKEKLKQEREQTSGQQSKETNNQQSIEEYKEKVIKFFNKAKAKDLKDIVKNVGEQNLGKNFTNFNDPKVVKNKNNKIEIEFNDQSTTYKLALDLSELTEKKKIHVVLYNNQNEVIAEKDINENIFQNLHSRLKSNALSKKPQNGSKIEGSKQKPPNNFEGISKDLSNNFYKRTLKALPVSLVSLFSAGAYVSYIFNKRRSAPSGLKYKIKKQIDNMPPDDPRYEILNLLDKETFVNRVYKVARKDKSNRGEVEKIDNAINEVLAKYKINKPVKIDIAQVDEFNKSKLKDKFMNYYNKKLSQQINVQTHGAKNPSKSYFIPEMGFWKRLLTFKLLFERMNYKRGVSDAFNNLGKDNNLFLYKSYSLGYSIGRLLRKIDNLKYKQEIKQRRKTISEKVKGLISEEIENMTKINEKIEEIKTQIEKISDSEFNKEKVEQTLKSLGLEETTIENIASKINEIPDTEFNKDEVNNTIESEIQNIELKKITAKLDVITKAITERDPASFNFFNTILSLKNIAPESNDLQTTKEFLTNLYAKKLKQIYLKLESMSVAKDAKDLRLKAQKQVLEMQGQTNAILKIQQQISKIQQQTKEQSGVKIDDVQINDLNITLKELNTTLNDLNTKPDKLNTSLEKLNTILKELNTKLNNSGDIPANKLKDLNNILNNLNTKLNKLVQSTGGLQANLNATINELNKHMPGSERLDLSDLNYFSSLYLKLNKENADVLNILKNNESKLKSKFEEIYNINQIILFKGEIKNLESETFSLQHRLVLEGLDLKSYVYRHSKRFFTSDELQVLKTGNNEENKEKYNKILNEYDKVVTLLRNIDKDKLTRKATKKLMEMFGLNRHLNPKRLAELFNKDPTFIYSKFLDRYPVNSTSQTRNELTFGFVRPKIWDSMPVLNWPRGIYRFIYRSFPGLRLRRRYAKLPYSMRDATSLYMNNQELFSKVFSLTSRPGTQGKILFAFFDNLKEYAKKENISVEQIINDFRDGKLEINEALEKYNKIESKLNAYLNQMADTFIKSMSKVSKKQLKHMSINEIRNLSRPSGEIKQVNTIKFEKAEFNRDIMFNQDKTQEGKSEEEIKPNPTKPETKPEEKVKPTKEKSETKPKEEKSKTPEQNKEYYSAYLQIFSKLDKESKANLFKESFDKLNPLVKFESLKIMQRNNKSTKATLPYIFSNISKQQAQELVELAKKYKSN